MIAVGKNIIIKDTQEKTTKTEGGLILAEKQREDIRYRQATIVAVGTLVEGIVPGDEVYYDKSSGFNIEIEKEQYKVIKEFDVVIVL